MSTSRLSGIRLFVGDVEIGGVSDVSIQHTHEMIDVTEFGSAARQMMRGLSRTTITLELSGQLAFDISDGVGLVRLPAAGVGAAPARAGTIEGVRAIRLRE